MSLWVSTIPSRLKICDRENGGAAGKDCALIMNNYFKVFFQEIWGIITIAVVAGFLFNIFSPNRISVIYSANNNPFFKTGPAVYAEKYPQVIGLKDAKARYDAGDAIFIDARPAASYLEGHIAGALSLPLEDFDIRFGEIDNRLPKNHDIIVYCDNVTCDLSTRVVYRLLEQGYLYCYIFENGIKHWQAMDYPVRSGQGDYE